MRNGLLLGIDIGAGSLRAGLVRQDGRVIASAAVPLTIVEPHRGWAELDPDVWWRAFVAATGRVLRAMPRSARVVGLCICGLTRTQVLLDRHGKPIGRAILFRDRRAADIARAMSGVTAFDAAARLAWIERHQPRRFARIDRVVEPKDYLGYRLCGGPPVDAATPWQRVGIVQALPGALARIAGVPLFAGAMDTWASAVGAGAVRAGQAYDVAGTSEAVGLLTPKKFAVPGLASLGWSENLQQVGGPTQAGADCARWCHALLRIAGPLDAAIERAGRIAPAAHQPLFLPYLAGERAPVWSSEVRGAFHGIDRAGTPDDFLRAVMEGVAMAVRDILDHAQAATGLRASELRVTGGGARSLAWCRIKADVTALPVIRSAEAETGVVGAAMAAAVGLGIYADMTEAADHMVTRVQHFAPRPQYTALLEARLANYRTMKAAALAMAVCA